MTATITNVVRLVDQVQVSFRFDDGREEQLTFPASTTKNTMGQAIQSRLDTLATAQTQVDQLLAFVGTVLTSR